MDGERNEINQGDHKFFQKEKGYITHFDKVSKIVNAKAGFADKDIPWKLVTQFALGTYLVLTCLVCFHRTNFVNLTAAAMGVMLITNTELVRWKVWRRYTALVACTFILDFIFLCFISSAQ